MDYEQPQPDSESKVSPESEATAEHGHKSAADGTNSLPAPKAENPWLETLKTIGLSAVLALGIRSFVAEARYIPSGSMLPTLQIDDRLIIDKISYRFSDPVRGDIIVFNPTAQLEKEKFKDAFIKRVIGVPGDRVDVKNGKVYINGKILTEKYLDEAPAYNWSSTSLTPDGIVPKDNYLVLGDNRNNSYDSHYWGFVPKDKIVGKATVRFWPIDRAGGINP
ncbi:signal peptidase I [Chamaesiphon sp.]|uniref:signal peptidase I n=1 Tax=Chamaesiphon sp. TaxID=2814140 RepID=UPI0035936648